MCRESVRIGSRLESPSDPCRSVESPVSGERASGPRGVFPRCTLYPILASPVTNRSRTPSTLSLFLPSEGPPPTHRKPSGVLFSCPKRSDYTLTFCRREGCETRDGRCVTPKVKPLRPFPHTPGSIRTDRRTRGPLEYLDTCLSR